MGLVSFRKLLRRGDPEGTDAYSFDRAFSNYQAGLYGILYAYLSGNETLEQAKKNLEDETAAAFVVAFYAGFGTARPDNQDKKWLVERYAKELVYIAALFAGLTAKRGLGLDTLALIALAGAHANSYAETLLGIFNHSKLSADGEVLLHLDGPDGRESCGTCQGLKGKPRPAKWWVDNELIPGPGTGYNYECGGFHCDHRLFNDAGIQYTL